MERTDHRLNAFAEATPYPTEMPLCAECGIVILPRLWLHAFHSLDETEEVFHGHCVEVIGEVK